MGQSHPLSSKVMKQGYAPLPTSLEPLTQSNRESVVISSTEHRVIDNSPPNVVVSVVSVPVTWSKSVWLLPRTDYIDQTYNSPGSNVLLLRIINFSLKKQWVTVLIQYSAARFGYNQLKQFYDTASPYLPPLVTSCGPNKTFFVLVLARRSAPHYPLSTIHYQTFHPCLWPSCNPFWKRNILLCQNYLSPAHVTSAGSQTSCFHLR